MDWVAQWTKWIEMDWGGVKWTKVDCSGPKWTEIDLIDQNAVLKQLNKSVAIITYTLKLLDIIYNIDKISHYY